MFKNIVFFVLTLSMIFGSSFASASTRKHKKKKKHHIYNSRYSKKVSKHSRKSKHFHHGTGPDLKSITTESPYKEDPNNGVNPIEVVK